MVHVIHRLYINWFVAIGLDHFGRVIFVIYIEIAHRVRHLLTTGTVLSTITAQFVGSQSTDGVRLALRIASITGRERLRSIRNRETRMACDEREKYRSRETSLLPERALVDFCVTAHGKRLLIISDDNARRDNNGGGPMATRVGVLRGNRARDHGGKKNTLTEM